MKKKVISYSYTGNNDALASEFAQEIGAEHLRITEPKKRTPGMILKEKLFNKDPKIEFSKIEITRDDFIIFFGPFWFGKMASPLRTCFKNLKELGISYGFVSLCVGFDCPEAYEDLKSELGSLLGKAPDFVIIKKIADLLPAEPALTPEMLTQYRIGEDQVHLLVASIRDEIESLPLLREVLMKA